MQPASAGRCPKCTSELREGWRVCPSCATPLEAETRTVYTESSSSSSLDEGRFPAGTILSGRYRIQGLIGRGGMGEVYRAYDLILNQAVALKFLGPANMSDAALARFRNEVRIARQVSHPNVCRVYDIGFMEGSHFLSMEYLDGEDLASLIRRIGRLPQDKAIEFTRKICAGLAAAHDRGVLHRDLKPANIMIDGRGQVRIADFGLAALAQEVALGDIRSGTPAYLSPEQKAGREVSTRSDLYSLGLTLHEMFTGKRRSETQSDPTDLVKDLDPAVERVILRCLEDDPKRRPPSALSVAMAMPGADPIAAALAAGETPSPEMVAASGEKEGLSRGVAVACFAIVVAVLAIFGAFNSQWLIINHTPLEIPPEGLAFRARDVLDQIGYAAKPKSTAYGFDYLDRDFVRYAARREPARFDELLASHRPAVISFWYREHSSDLLADSFLPSGWLVWGYNDVIGYDSPANTEPGMIRLRLDAKGRLIALEVRPEETEPGSGSPAAFDGSSLFKAAQLDASRFYAGEPQGVPAVPFDARAAWDGTFEAGRTERVHVEAAGWRGKPVYFAISGDWQQQETAITGVVDVVYQWVYAIFLAAELLGAAFLAWRNVRLGRCDRRGAVQIAAAAFLAAMLGWAFSAAHVASLWEFHMLIKALSWAGFVAACFWLLYLGIEPHVRRHWPDSLIAWGRLQAGKLKDPLVGSHVLIGVAVFVVIDTLLAVDAIGITRHFKDPFPGILDSLNSVAVFWGTFFANVGTPFSPVLLVAAMLRMFVRRRLWMVDLFAAAIIALPAFFFFEYPAANLMNGAGIIVFNLTLLWLLRRFGLLAAFTGVLTDALLQNVVPIQLTTWFGGRGLVVLAILALAAAWGLWTVLSAQKGPVTESA